MAFLYCSSRIKTKLARIKMGCFHLCMCLHLFRLSCLYFPDCTCICLGRVFVFSSSAYLYLPRPRICIFLGRVHLALFNLSAKWAIVGANVRSGPDWRKQKQNFKTNILNQTLHNAIECEQWTSAEEKIETNATSVKHHQVNWRFIWNQILVR